VNWSEFQFTCKFNDFARAWNTARKSIANDLLVDRLEMPQSRFRQMATGRLNREQVPPPAS
jgi:hypothetical protein